jgi:hypothetical protein
MTKLRPSLLYLAFVLVFPVIALMIVGTPHAGEVCARVMGGTDEAARFWYEIPCSDDFRASSWWFGYIGAFVVTGLYAGIAFPVSMVVSGFIIEKLAPNKALLVEWIVTAVLVAIPLVVMLLAFA